MRALTIRKHPNLILKSERHHWWPRCVSKHWAGEDGRTGWISADGTVRRLPPDQLGMIGNGHHIKLGPALGGEGSWDSSFEREFDMADRNFPSLIAWMETLRHEFLVGHNLSERLVVQAATEDQLRMLTESVVSLAVRSPRNREASVALAEKIRGSIPNFERNALIGMNMRQSQRIISDTIGARGKFAVLFSTGREFIFGDGFFHNCTAVCNPPHAPKLLVPITPGISVIVSRPGSFTVEPPLSVIVLNDEEVETCNFAIQVYSRDALFFRQQKPSLTGDFTCKKHLAYLDSNNSIDTLMRDIFDASPMC